MLSDEEKYAMIREYGIFCEEYDRTVCTGPYGPDGGILPANSSQSAKINRNARAVQRRVMQKYGATHDEFRDSVRFLRLTRRDP